MWHRVHAYCRYSRKPKVWSINILYTVLAPLYTRVATGAPVRTKFICARVYEQKIKNYMKVLHIYLWLYVYHIKAHAVTLFYFQTYIEIRSYRNACHLLLALRIFCWNGIYIYIYHLLTRYPNHDFGHDSPVHFERMILKWKYINGNSLKRLKTRLRVVFHRVCSNRVYYIVCIYAIPLFSVIRVIITQSKHRPKCRVHFKFTVFFSNSFRDKHGTSVELLCLLVFWFIRTRVSSIFSGK